MKHARKKYGDGLGDNFGDGLWPTWTRPSFGMCQTVGRHNLLCLIGGKRSTDASYPPTCACLAGCPNQAQHLQEHNNSEGCKMADNWQSIGDLAKRILEKQGRGK